MAHFAALNDHANPDITHVKSYTRSNYLSDSGILAGNFDRSGSLSTNVDRRSPATNPGHTLDKVIALAWISGS